MGEIVSNFFISVDGVVESPDQWHFPYWSDEMGEVVGEGMETCAAFLMGRTLYDEWSDYWPQQPDGEEFAGFINTIPKYVVSSSLTEATWQNTEVVTGGDAAIAERLRAVRDGLDGDIGISGSATLVRWLLGQGLLGRFELLVHPVAVGRGQRLFEDTPASLSLERSRTLPNGVLHLTYRPVEAPPAA